MRKATKGMQKLRRSAVHEFGHAVLAHRLGCKVSGVVISDRLINLPMCDGTDTVEEFKSWGGTYRQNLTPLPSDSPAVAVEKAAKNYIISSAGMRAES
jgi:hypothetical protein